MSAQAADLAKLISNILGKAPGEPKLDEVLKLDKQLGGCPHEGPHLSTHLSTGHPAA